MRVVDWIGVVEFGVLVEAGLLVVAFECPSDTTHLLVEEYFTICSIAYHDLVESLAPSDSCH